MLKKLAHLCFVLLAPATALSFQTAETSNAQLEGGRAAIHSMTGCYLVDYSYSETESLKAGYVRDGRVYDVNKNKSVKEWIYADHISANRIRLQHVMFMTDLNGKFVEGSELKHQAEDWEFGANTRYDFKVPMTWVVQTIPENQWLRRITNLDDGLRYQCAAQWKLGNGYPEWTCANYSPIPGRETRDMGRKDYNTLDRNTRLIAYQNSWLERQNNVKTIDQAGVRTPLARELGKTWYVRLPDSDCVPALQFIQPRKAYWELLRETWDDVLDGRSTFVEKAPTPGAPPRFVAMMSVEEKAMKEDLNEKSARITIKTEIQKIIETYRAH